jgi:hypothetical protein
VLHQLQAVMAVASLYKDIVNGKYFPAKNGNYFPAVSGK